MRTRILGALALASVAWLFLAISADRAQAASSSTQCDEDLPKFILRQDFTDIPILSICADPETSRRLLKTAVGARASYTYDDIRGASSMSVDGLAALNFQYTPDKASQYLSTISFGPFAQGSGQHTFATPAASESTSGAVTAGAYVQFYLERPIPLLGPLPFVLRLRGGELADSTNVRDGTAVFELIPAFQLQDLLGQMKDSSERWKGFGFGSPFDLFPTEHSPTILFAPEIEAQYDTYQSGPLTYGIFAAHHEAMRVGPLLVFKLSNLGNFLEASSPLCKPLNKFALSASYHVDWDTFSDRHYSSFSPAIIYNLDDDGHYAVTAGYTIGNSEASGNKSRQVKAAFSAKF